MPDGSSLVNEKNITAALPQRNILKLLKTIACMNNTGGFHAVINSVILPRQLGLHYFQQLILNLKKDNTTCLMHNK